MPEVRRATPGQVSARALPGARLESSETDISAGAGLERAKAARADIAADTLGRIGRQTAGIASAMIAEERQNADEIALLKAQNELHGAVTKAMYDPATGVMNRKGEAAQGIPEEMAATFGKEADRVGAGMKTPTQQRAFARMRLQFGQQIDLETRRHVFGEMQTFRANELDKSVANGVDAAIRSALDPQGIKLELDRIESNIRVNSPKLGAGKEEVEAQLRGVRSAVHTGVISSLLATDKDRQASDYFAAVKDQIAADKLDDVQKALDEGSLRGESQRTADKIIAQGGTLTEQLAKAKELEPKLREHVEARLEHNDAVADRAERDAAEARSRGAYDIVDKTGTVTKIPPDVWTKLPGATRSALKSYAEDKARGIPTKTDQPTFYALMKQAGDDPTAFVKVDLLNSRHKLSDADFQQLAGLQLSIKSGNRAAASKDIADFMTNRQVADNALRQIGLNPDATMKSDPDTAAQVANFYRLIDTRVNALQTLTGKKAGSADVQQITDDLLAQQVNTPGWFGTNFGASKKTIFALTIDDIPADQRTQIESALRNKNMPVSDPQILNLYLEGLARGLVKR